MHGCAIPDVPSLRPLPAFPTLLGSTNLKHNPSAVLSFPAAPFSSSWSYQRVKLPSDDNEQLMQMLSAFLCVFLGSVACGAALISARPHAPLPHALHLAPSPRAARIVALRYLKTVQRTHRLAGPKISGVFVVVAFSFYYYCRRLGTNDQISPLALCTWQLDVFRRVSV